MLMANNDGVQKNAGDDRLSKFLLGRGMVVSGCERVLVPASLLFMESPPSFRMRYWVWTPSATSVVSATYEA